VHDLKFSFFWYSGLPNDAVEQKRNPDITMAAGTTSFQLRIAFSFRLKAYPVVSIF
jgi:hypothetical protein